MNEILMWIISLFVIISIIDRVGGFRWGFGEEFIKAFQSMGALALSMIGMISLSPVLARWLIPIVTPVFEACGADPSMFASMVFALDMGGQALAEEMALTKEAAYFSWVFVGTMMGPTIVFTIPVALNMLKEEDLPFFAQGILIGLITIPLGCLIGGLVAGYSLLWMLPNLLPAVICSVIISLLLKVYPKLTIRLFTYFSKLVEWTLMVGLVCIALEALVGVKVFKGMIPISESFQIVGSITITLAGAFPLMYGVQKLLKNPVMKIGKKSGLDEYSLLGPITSLAHHIPMFTNLQKMTPRGKVLNTAFAVSGAFTFGSHLGFVASAAQSMIFPMIIGKLSAGILAWAVAWIVTRE
ncbi:ethanolamine utilization protein EutH [Cytobacillus spongiae]|uniref:ethanolamine utilization protein EutH n=1 Tax=Cytobacillus spongiae TaxID=2901381 RepID=UPI001F1AD6A0|nr:ethanolamine utilization protein EutH [Cytobacillus spongiae]UII57078.1 ethanolamine utilization protein EutH [Cytobacillus spongiae]